MPTRRDVLIHVANTGALVATAGALKQGEGASESLRTRSERMRTCRIPHSDLYVSRIAFGTGMIGTSWRSPEFIPTTVRAIETAYDNGVSFFDTADTYAAGQAEVALGKFLKRSVGIRNQLVLQSKCGGLVPNGWTPGDQISANSNYGSQYGVDLRRSHILAAVEGSLKRLGTDWLDLLLLHAPDALMQPEEVASAFDKLKADGKVRHFGVSNFNATQIELLRKYVRQPIVASQIQLGLAHYAPIVDPSTFGGLVDYCHLNDIQIQAYSPLKGRSAIGRPILLSPIESASAEVRQAAHILAQVAHKNNASPASTMIAWLLRHPACIVPVIGASTTEHIVDNCSADRVNLSREDWVTLLHAATPVQS